MSDGMTMRVRTLELDRGSLGIRAVEFRNDGTIAAHMHDGSAVHVSLPSGWKAQPVGSAIVYQCPCGALVLGAPVHDHG